MIQQKQISEFQQFLKDNFPGSKFRKDTIIQAGKRFKNSEDKQSVIEFLTGKEDDSNFQPPSKCNIIGKSRSFEDWDYSICSSNIQKYIYSLSLVDFEALNVQTDRKSIDNFLSHVPNYNQQYKDIQGLNLIIRHSINRYSGVLENTKNRNEKLQEKANKLGLVFEPISPTNDDGFLAHPPGVNTNIYCYQNSKVRILDPIKDKEILQQLPVEYHNYQCSSNDIIPIYNIDRLSIPQGQRGYIPQWQKDNNLIKSGKRRVRKWYSNQQLKARKKRTCKINETAINQDKAKDALLAVLNVGKDWCVIDIRGLLRNVRWRKLVDNTLTLNDLLNFFTGDTVIDPKRNIITFCYKPGKIKIHSEYLIHGEKTKQVLEKLTEQQSIALVSIDLGATHPQASQYFKINQSNNELNYQSIAKEFLPRRHLLSFEGLKNKHDTLSQDINQAAINALSSEQQEEIKQIDSFPISNIKQSICLKYGLNIQELPWDKMSNYTYFISDSFIEKGGKKELVYFESKSKKGKIKNTKKSDYKHAMEFKPRLSKETAEAKNLAKWNLQIHNQEYEKLRKTKEQLCRTIVNDTIAYAQDLTGCQTVVIAIENLTMNNKMFSGSGKRDIGFDNFYVHKKENRWLMQGLHKAYSEKAKHNGMKIMEINPQRTSITCIDCLYCNRDNRNGENFKCKKCHIEYHADLDIATHNIMKVAITGLPMPKFICEGGK